LKNKNKNKKLPAWYWPFYDYGTYTWMYDMQKYAQCEKRHQANRTATRYSDLFLEFVLGRVSHNR